MNLARLPRLALGAVLTLGTLARLAPLAINRFHQDEAIYSYWAMQIVSGRDVLLSHLPVDKPPLFIYTLALSLGLFGPSEVAARLPGELSSAASLVLLYYLVRRLYDLPAALIATTLMAFSPFGILFAPTALTDPLMVAWALAALCCAVDGRFGWAGALLGLAAITKPQGLFFAPLAVVVGLERGKLARPEIIRLGTGFVGAVLPAVLWDLVRVQRPGFLEQSLISYGGLGLAAPEQLAERGRAWLALMGYVTASPVLNALLILGAPCLLACDLCRRGRERLLDAGLTGFIVVFLLVHWLLNFNVWDRYLLGLIPFTAILLARIILLPGQIFGRRLALLEASVNYPVSTLLPGDLSSKIWDRPLGTVAYGLIVTVFLGLTLVKPARDAANSRYPIGGDHGAYQGLEAVVDYFRGNVPGGAIVYHRWLGWHFSFYMFNFPYDFRWYTTPRELAEDARQAAEARRYVVFPSWKSATATSAALAQEGLTLRRIYWTYRQDGSLSFTVYTIDDRRPFGF